MTFAYLLLASMMDSSHFGTWSPKNWFKRAGALELNHGSHSRPPANKISWKGGQAGRPPGRLVPQNG